MYTISLLIENTMIYIALQNALNPWMIEVNLCNNIYFILIFFKIIK